MNSAVQIILDFVEGRMSGKDFEQKLYHDPALEAELKDDSLKWHDTYIKTNPYDYLIGLHYDETVGGLLNAQGTLEAFLTRRGVPFRRTSRYSDFHDLLFRAQPRWLNLDPNYLEERILPEAEGRQGSELRQWLAARLLDLFRYHKKPPKWIQGAAWPISQSGPMYFLGQMKIEGCEHFHDDGAAYVFLDLKTGETRTIIQLY